MTAAANNVGTVMAGLVQSSAETSMLVTMRVADQLFGIPVQHVRDVLKEQKVAQIPLAPREISGSINLRGRIVTVVNLRERLRLQDKQEGTTHMFVVVEFKGEFYSLMVDAVGEVLTIPTAHIEKSPANLVASWKEVASGIHRLQDELLVVIDIQALLTL
jgi:purine-binding chemotaxis protein CheW